MPDSLAYPNVDRILSDAVEDDPAELSDEEIVDVLASYWNEAEDAYAGGPNPRKDIWRTNWDRYWGRYSNAQKADWQSQHVMPESPQFVDRWAAAMREALDRPGEWFTTMDATGAPSQVTVHITKTMKVILNRISRTMDGHVADFSSFFEDQMKMGALMACCAGVTWEEDKEAPDGWVRVNTIDPREVRFDPKFRNLYRARQYEIDHFELMSLAREYDEELDEEVYNLDAILDLSAEEDEARQENLRTSTGTGSSGGGATGRKPIKLNEWYCTIVSDDGEVAYSDVLCIVANDRHLIRGPEVNPFWHDRDWIVFTPMVSVPLSIYGRTYMEEWADVADAFVELTNLILDGVFTTTVKAFIANPDLLDDPTQLDEGISPNKIFKTSEEIADLRRFIATIDLGTLPADAYTVWTALKNELREGAKLSEIALGQMAPNSRTTATEIQVSTQSGSAMIRSMARTIEARFVEPILNLIWKTALQHMDFTTIADAIGTETAQMFNDRREDFLEASITFKVRAISGIVDRQQRLQNLMQALQVIGQNELLAQQLFRQMNPQKLVDMLLSMFNIDISEFQLTEQEQMIQQLETQVQEMQAAAQQGQQGQQPQQQQAPAQ